MNDKVSIIMPIYNGGKYLKTSIESILHQTYDNYELLLIDDGSTDNTSKICEEYSKSNDKIKYFRKENSGVSDSRNYGLNHATGKYISFIDADDYVRDSFLENLVSLIKDTDASMSCTLVARFDGTIKEEPPVSLEVKTYEKKNKYDILYNTYGGYLCNKLFLKEVIDKNYLSLDKSIGMMEDMLFVYNYLKCVSSVATSNSKDYMYRMDNNSASKKLCNTKWFTLFKVLDIMLKDKDSFNDYTYKKQEFFYYYYLLEGKYRLKYIKDYDKFEDLYSDIMSRLASVKNKVNIKDLRVSERIKIFIYKRFNSISFSIKFWKDRLI